jgi:hypothetical protein
MKEGADKPHQQQIITVGHHLLYNVEPVKITR